MVLLRVTGEVLSSGGVRVEGLGGGRGHRHAILHAAVGEEIGEERGGVAERVLVDVERDVGRDRVVEGRRVRHTYEAGVADRGDHASRGPAETRSLRAGMLASRPSGPSSPEGDASEPKPGSPSMPDCSAMEASSSMVAWSEKPRARPRPGVRPSWARS